MVARRVFDRRYYDRFYRHRDTRITTPAATRRLADFVASYVRYMELPVRRILDLGCGTGALGRALQRRFPGARFTGVEASAYACRRYGWERGRAEDYQSSVAFDLVICNDVLQYLDTAAAALAMENLARLCRGALYLGVPTRRDWQRACDRTLTDRRVYFRSGAWYRRRLARAFVTLGGGMYLRSDAPALLYELDLG